MLSKTLNLLVLCCHLEIFNVLFRGLTFSRCSKLQGRSHSTALFSSLALFLLLLGPLRMGGSESALRSVIKVPETESFCANGSVPLPPSLFLAPGLVGGGRDGLKLMSVSHFQL